MKDDLDGHNFEDVERLIYDDLIPHAEKVVFHKGRPGDFELVGMYTSIIEMSWGCLALIEKRLGYHSYLLLRQVLEIFVELRILSEDPSFLDQLRYRNAKSTKLKFENATNGNPYLSSISSSANFNKLVEENKEVLSGIGSKWARAVNVEEKFRIANMSEQYEGLYRVLSDHMHSNFGALVSRHVKFEDESNSFHAFNHGGKEDFLEVTTSLHELLSEASEIIKQKFD